jgi:flagellar motility protein MotE (MotC chaperone)
MADKKHAKKMSREQASELYRDLRKAMQTLQERKQGKLAPSKGIQDIAKSIAASISKSMAQDTPAPSAVKSFVEEEAKDSIARAEIETDRKGFNSGHYAAMMIVLFCALTKVVLSGLEASGVMTVTPALANVNTPVAERTVVRDASLSKEEVHILTTLDARRAELEERARRFEEKEQELSKRDREFVTKVQELRDLTEQLKLEREKSEKKRNAQLEQLANVYGSMAPQEAAGLIEQLDITIALPLMERMPEKRIGQILALMSRERALAMTKMLSGRQEK